MKNLKTSIAVIGMMFLLTACGSEPEQNTTIQQITTTEYTTEYVTETLTTEEITTEDVTEIVTEAKTEETTTNQTTLDKLNEISVSIVDEFHGTKEDAGWVDNQFIDSNQTYLSENYNECTILTLAAHYPDRLSFKHTKVQFNDSTGKTLDYVSKLYEISDRSEQYDDSCNWYIEQEDGSVYWLLRIRIGGNIESKDIVAHISWDDELETSIDKNITTITSFEELQPIFVRNAISNEDDANNKIQTIYKIQGKYYMVVPTHWGESSSSCSRNINGEMKHYSTEGYYFMFIPLQGSAKVDISEEGVDFESEPDTKYNIGVSNNWESRKSVIHNRGTMFSVALTYLADEDANWYANWDSLSEEEKNGCSSVYNFANEKRFEKSLKTYMTFPDGDGGITKILGAIPRRFNTVE